MLPENVYCPQTSCLLWQYVLSWRWSVFISAIIMLWPWHTIPEYFPSFHHHANQQNIGSWNNEQMRAWISWILLLHFHPQIRYSSVIHSLHVCLQLHLLINPLNFLYISPHNLLTFSFFRSMVTLHKATSKTIKLC